MPTIHTINQRVFEEVAQPSVRSRSVVCVLQLQSSSHDFEGNASDGQRIGKPCLDNPRTDRGIGQVLKLESKLSSPGDMLGLVRFTETPMRHFFNPLRRKIGVVTLVMACMLAAGWVRSLFFRDWTQVGPINQRLHVLESDLGELIWFAWDRLPPFDPKWNSEPVEPPRGYENTLIRPLFVRSIGGIVYIDKGQWYYGCKLVVPYSTLVIPLTLLSAWLLLSQPCGLKKADPLSKDGTRCDPAVDGYFSG